MRRGVIAVIVLAAVARLAQAEDGSEPVPIPGGTQGFHAFAPGPRRLGLMGLNVEPGTITNFQGDVALAYLIGTATAGDGHAFSLQTDMRLMRGEFVSADGVHRQGVFGFV